MAETQNSIIGTVKLRVREIYGRTVYYPANKDAEKFCAIAKSKTMTDETMRLVKDLGFEIITDRIVL